MILRYLDFYNHLLILPDVGVYGMDFMECLTTYLLNKNIKYRLYDISCFVLLFNKLDNHHFIM